MTAPAHRETLAGGFTRRGACPALSAPMQTGDGLLVRLNPVDGGLSPGALIGLCEASLGHGNGIVEVTSRGSLQIRGLTPHSAAALARDIDALAIAVRTGVPVQTGALAGLDPGETADPAGLAGEIRAGIVASGLDARLGPKVSVVVDGGGRSALAEVSADVRLTALGSTLWRVAVGGDAGTATVLGVFDARMARESALEVLAAVADRGFAARARDLTSSDLPAAKPAVSDLLLSPLDVEISSRTGAMERDSRNPKTLLAIVPLGDQRFALGVALPFGAATADTMIAFAQAAENLGVCDVRLAPKHTILALCPTREAAEALLAEARRLDFVTSAADPRQNISACPGAPACASGRLPARQLAAEIAGGLDAGASIHVSGCAKGCAHPGKADITIVGSENGAGIVVAGTARDVPLAYTAHARRGFDAVASLVRSEAARGESTGQTLRRVGPAAIARVFE